MRFSRLPFLRPFPGSLRLLGFAIVLGSGLAHGQSATPEVANAANGWQRYDWLKESEEQQRAAAAGDSYSVKTSQDVNDPFAVVNSASLWQQKVDATYTRRIADALSLSYQTSSTMLNGASLVPITQADGSPYDLSRGQKLGAQFQPVEAVLLRGDLHETTTDAALPGDAITTTGAGFSAETHLPKSAVLTLSMNYDRTGSEAKYTPITTTSYYEAQYRQPLGSLPLTAVLKSNYLETATTGTAPSSLPSLEQSLVWKPLQETTVQMGLRQQRYQEYPGIANQFNQALFADWSQQMSSDITWHSYAEVLNTRGLIDQAPAAPIASGANGTPQATTPDSNVGLTSAVPLTLQDQTVTFTTGPSFQLQKDISASFEYSNRWDKNPAAGSVGQEQRVSVSVKGSF